LDVDDAPGRDRRDSIPRPGAGYHEVIEPEHWLVTIPPL